MDASSALHLLDMEHLSTFTAAVGGWPTAGEDTKGSTSDGSMDAAEPNNDNSSAPSSDLDQLYLQVQTQTHTQATLAPGLAANRNTSVDSENTKSSTRHELSRVVSNDEEEEESDYKDDIPDLTITRTASFDDEEDEEENSIHRKDVRSLPVICEQDEDVEDRDDDSNTPSSIGVSPVMMKSKNSSTLLVRSTPQTSDVHTDCIRSMLYDEVRQTTERCVEMQKELDDKDTELKELDESKQLIIKRYREARDHHRNTKRRFESIYKKMIAGHSKEHFKFHAAIEERDRKIQERDAVIRQLKDANEKLEVALRAMTKVAENALRAKKQVREDLKKLKSKHLKDVQTLTMKHETTIKELKSSISTKVLALHELESTKFKLVDQLQAREKELQLEIKMRKERSAASYDVDSAKRLLMEGAARNNANVNARVVKKEKKKQIPKQIPPSPREIEVRHECHWLHEQISMTIQKIVNAKCDIENMEISANKMVKKPLETEGILARAKRKPLHVQTDN